MAVNQVRSGRYAFRGLSLPVLEMGEGSPIGYLHGPLGNPGIPPIIERLAETRRVIAPTLPGFFGGEPCEQLRNIHDWIAALSEIVDVCGLSGAPVLASSVTAMLALELAAIRPAAFAHLFLVAPLGLWNAEEPVADLFARLSGQERGLLVTDPGALAEIFEDEQGAEAKDKVRKSVDRFVARTTSASIIWPIPEFGLADRIHRVTNPVTLLWGSADQYAPPSYADRFARLLPNVQGTHLIGGAAHLVDLDCPDAVAAVVESALNPGPGHSALPRAAA